MTSDDTPGPRDEGPPPPFERPPFSAPGNVDGRPLAPGLYLVATPIGNLEDITLRALRVLRSVDRIACEDTRHTAKLLAHFGIQKPTVSLHLHNESERGEELLKQLREGARLAVVSDAGTPGIADPGAALVREAVAAGLPVFALPGANAALTALVASGLETERFTFHGFLPAKEGGRRTELEHLRSLLQTTQNGLPATQIFYETPHRILAALHDIREVFGPTHRIALARELTKLHEEFLRGTVAEVIAALKDRPSLRGEMVLLLHGAAEADQDEGATSLADAVRALLQSGLTEKEALKQAARSRNIGKSEAYREWQRRKR